MDASNDAYAVFNLNQQFTTFSGKIVANQNTGSDAILNIAIYIDDSLVYSKTEFTKRTGAVDFSLDVRGATKLEIRTSNTGGYSNGHFSIVNTQLEKQP